MPESAKSEEVVELDTCFRELIRGMDLSLFGEWERLRDPNFAAVNAADKPARPPTFDITRDDADFRGWNVRRCNAVH